MTQDEIIEMARQVGAKTPRLIWPPTFTKSIDFTPEALEIFAKLVAVKEREKWSGVEAYLIAASEGSMSRNNSEALANELLTAIRARGEPA
jgi:hypothetical protein